MLIDIENVTRSYLTHPDATVYGQTGIYIFAFCLSRSNFLKFMTGLLSANRPIHLFEWPLHADIKKIIGVAIRYRRIKPLIFLIKRMKHYDHNLIKYWLKESNSLCSIRLTKCLLSIMLNHKIKLNNFCISESGLNSYDIVNLNLLGDCLKFGLIKSVYKDGLFRHILKSNYPSPTKIDILEKLGLWDETSYLVAC